ncbi:MAG: TolC family protein [Fibrobacteraceae bacterium]|nr:TolC family protein [Fibrobacteraceae bacterium]
MKLSQQKASLIILLIAVSAFAADWTLEDCLKRAEEASLSLKVSKLGEEQAAIAIKTAKTDRYPSLSANINNTLYDNPFVEGPKDHYRLSLGISGSIILWNGGATSLSVETAQIDKQEAEMRTALASLNLRVSVLDAYYAYLTANEKIEIAKKALEISEAEKENQFKLFEAGNITKRDLVLAEADAAQKQVSLLTAEQAKTNAETTLRQLLEIPREEEFRIIAENLDSLTPESLEEIPSLDSILNLAKSSNPNLVADSLATLSAEKNVKLAGKNSSISVTLGAQAGTGLQAWESDGYGNQLKYGYNHSVTLGINIPIIDKGSTTNKVLNAQIQSERSKITQQETLKALENLMEQLYLNAMAAENQWKAAMLQVQANEAAFQVADDQKNLGAITYTDYLSYKADLETSKITLTQAKYSALLARSLLKLYCK